MNTRRSAAGLVVLLIAILAMLAFLYALPSGRRARREALRAFRLARNAIGIAPVPVLSVRVWDETGMLLVEVHESGRLSVSGRGERQERQLAPAVRDGIVAAGRAALGDFSDDACGTERGSRGSALYVLVDGAWVGAVCHNASNWPKGTLTKQLLAGIDAQVPGFLVQR